MLREALFLAEQELAVFPCRGKDPAIKGGAGCKDASTDPKTIRQMWRDEPGSNIGIATGAKSGVWVLDIDPDKGAEAALAGLEAQYGKLPETVMTLTGRGGRHLFFGYHGERIFNRNSDIGPGIDVKAEGGYVIAAPSVHPDTGKAYEWADGVLPDLESIPDAPEWLMGLVTGPNKAQRERQQAPSPQRETKPPSIGSGNRSYYEAALDGESQAVAKMTKGSRNGRLNIAALKLGGYVAAGHLERKVVEAALFDAAVACGHVADDGENVARNTIKSGLEAGIAQGPKSAPEREQKPQQQARNGKTEALIIQHPAAAVTIPSAKPPILMNSADDVLEAFNEKYAVVNESGKVVVYNPKRDEQLKRDTIERIMFEDFRRMYMNHKVEVGVSKKGNPIYSNIGDVWLEHPKRRQFLGGVVMSPGNKVPDDCWNLWRGFTVDPMPGDWSRMYDHIRDVICGGDQKVFAYTLGWLARMVQQPDKQGEVALVLRGKKGTGKGTLGNWMVRLLGQHSVHVYHAKHLVGTFNAHLRDAVFVFADEAFFAGDKAHEGMLKGLVTEPIITIEAKYQNAVSIANMTHILMASNSDWVVPTSSDERRFCVMDVSDHRIGDKAYFTALNEQMENGGLAAMLHDLLNMDLSKFNVRDVPQTDALADQKRLSLDSLHRWWFTVLQRGFVWRSRYGAAIFMDWSDFVSTELLYRSYLQWCNETREGRPMSREQLGVMMKGLYQNVRPRGHHPVYEIESMDSQEGKVAATMERPQGYKVGSLRIAQLQFTKANGIAFDWEDDEPTEDFDF